MFPVLSANGTSGYNLTNSLRFRNSASAYLSRTPASASNQQIWTWSAWVKRGQLGAYRALFTGRTSASATYTITTFTDTDNLAFYDNGGATLITTSVYRDPSAWYHIVYAVDTTQATASNRVKIYVNGVQVTAFGTATYPTQNANLNVNSTATHVIGDNTGAAQYYDGYMTEVNFVNAQQLAPTSFGSTNATTGVWQPAKYTGTYGTNGFYLNFNSIALTSGSNTGLGKDNSGNGNYWNTNNISVTAGTTYDAMTDVPTLTSATVANYAVMNPLWTDGTVSITQGNLNVSSGNYGGFSTLTIPTNSKFYAEFTVTATQGNQGVGILKAANAYSGVISQADMFGSNSVTYYCVNGNKFVLGGGSTAYGSSWGTVGDVIGIAVDTVNNQITFYKNNTSQGVITGLTSGIEWVFSTGNQTSTGGGAWNFGQRPFSYTAPSGFVALNTYNLPTSTIVQGNKYMDATLWTGTGASNSIVNTAAFKPDFVWIKQRNGTAWNNLNDSVRGAQKQLYSNSTSAETSVTDELQSFNSNGFTLSTSTNVNGSANTYVGWQWQAGQGSSSSNTNGSITSNVSVNTTAGFSVVTYTGTGTAGTIGHGLGVAPAFTIFKNRTSGTPNWVSYHKSLGATKGIYLNLTNAAATDSVWQNTSPTSSVISIAGSASANVNTNGNNYVCYAWAEIAGFSSFGSYTGNGSTDGTFVYTGFRPKFILIKASSQAGNDWQITDTNRSTYNAAAAYLYPDLTNAEGGGSFPLDLLSNGFKLRNTTGDNNNSGVTFIYAAFAENPFKNALAR